MAGKSLQLEGLKSFIDQQNPHGAREFIDNIVNFFDSPLTSAELDVAIEKLFNKGNGTIQFLKASIQAKKLFQEANVNILTLWHNLITKHSSTSDFTPYAGDIVQCCLKFILAHIGPSAKERERATIVIQILVQKNLIDEDLAESVLDRILNVFNLTKPTELFIYQIYKLVGMIAKFYPSSVLDEHAKRFKVECFRALDSIVNTRQEIRYKTIAGAMEGLSDYLTNFAPSPEAEPETCERIYAFTKKLSNLPEDIKQKSAFRAALELFSTHSFLFSKQIYTDFEFWHRSLEKWLDSNVYEDRRRGVFASYAFHKVLAEELEADNRSESIETLRFVLNEFRKTLESAKSTPEDTRIAIRGFGTISKLCKRHLPTKLDEMISLLVQRCELILMADDKAMRDLLDHFPDYILALSTVVKEVQDPQISDIMVENLRNIMIRLIRDFHFLPTCHCNNVSSSMTNAFNSIYLTNPALLERLLTKVIFEGVVWTCSHKHTFDANEDWMDNIDWKDNITYKSYSILWHALLDMNSGPRFIDKSLISDKILDHLIFTLFNVLSKLDLRTKKRVYTAEDGTDQEFHFCDPNFDLCPVRPKDFHIFINLVDFYRDLCPKFHRQSSMTWIEKFCEEMVKYSLRNPLVSGFLKLLEVGLSTAEYLKLFTREIAPELEATLAHALKIMTVRCLRVSGELQISTIELVLQYPVQFYNACLIEMIPIFETALDLGKSMSWLANLAIDCLEKISNHYDTGDLKKLHAKVLPLLDSYLQGHCSVEYLNIREGRGGNKLRTKGPTKKFNTDMHVIQAKIVSLLGKLHPEAASLLVLNSVKSENLVKWHSEKCIHLNLKFPDINPMVYLDALVPRVCHLALTSTDRQTKIAACEIVHALVLYLIGARAHQGQIWKEVCKRVLILGCDGDGTVQQIFEPLLMQVMHFMSKYENLDRGVEEIMDALMDGISSKSNFGLRDLSASCLREFVEWSIKQTTPQQLAASPVSMEIILGRLKMYSFDSDPSKRVGAALAFNNLYRRLREEEAICDIFFVDLLHTFCVNFKLSEELTTLPPNDDMNSDLEMISEALDHVVRVLSERNYLYNKESSRRNVPSPLQKGTLVDVVKFLIFETGSRKIFYRRKCMKLAHALAPKVSGTKSLGNFFNLHSISEHCFREICEGPADGCGIAARPDITYLSLTHFESPEVGLYKWLECFLSSLECYTWLLREKAITKNRNFFNDTNILHVIAYYLNEICWTPISTILQSVDSTSSSRFPDSQVLENMDVLKCLIAMHIVEFLTEFLQSGCALEEDVDFWDADTSRCLRKLILQLIYEPETLHLDFRLEKVFTRRDARVDEFCRQTKTNCPRIQFFNELNQDVIDTLVSRLNSFSMTLPNILKTRDSTAVKPDYVGGILHILKITNLSEIESAKYKDLVTASECIMKTLFDGIKRISFGKAVVASHAENVKRLANRLMTTAFAVRDFSNEVLDFLLDATLLHTASLDAKIKYGSLYFERYETVIYQQVTLTFFEKCFLRFPTSTAEDQSYLLRILTGVLDYRRKSSRDITQDFKRIIDLCIQNLPTLIEHFTDEVEDFQFIEYLAVLTLIASENSIAIRDQVPTLERWIMARLRSAHLNLEKKCKIISLLPILVGPADDENKKLMYALEDFQSRHFPLHSTEFAKNSLEETSLRYAYVALLNTLVTSKSFVILEFLFKCTASDDKHLMEDEIRKKLKTFTLCLSKDQQINVLSRTFAIALEDSYEPKIRLTIFRRFLLTIFANCCEEALMDFLEGVIKQINQLIEANYRVVTFGRTVQQALVNRIVGYGLIEHFFGTVRKELYWSKTCPIAVKLLGEPKTDSELVGTFTKKAFYVRVEEFTTTNKDATELFRQYQCSAFCALCSLVSNTQTELKFFSKFLFEENTKKNEFIWSRLLDCSPGKHYLFPGQEMEEYAKIRKRFVAIRQLDVRPSVTLKAITSSRRLQTQNVMESSLSQDVRGIDMTSYSVRTHSEAMRRQEIRSAEAMSVRLESNDLNKHEVMAMLCGVIKFMHTNNITPVITDISIKRSYPWVQAISKAIGTCEYHNNIRVFLAQVVDNCSEVFQQFAHVLFKPILRMLVDECAGSGLNFFITDMISLLITWSSQKLHTPGPAEATLIEDLLKFIMKNAWNDKKEILKFNLGVVQTMLTAWKDVIVVPSNVLLDMISRSERTDSTANECGIIFLGMILSNNLIPWTDVNKVLYINAILRNIENESTTIYQPAAYALGASLDALLKSGDQESAENLLLEVHTRLQALNSKKDRKSEKRFVDITYNIHKASPQIVDNLREIICFKIPIAVGVAKRNLLEMVLSRIESFNEDEVYNTIIGIGIKDLLKQSDYQLLGLHILNRSLPMLKNHDITQLFNLVQECLELQQTDCRDIAYEVCIYAAQNFAPEFRDQSIALLLKGISDPDVEIQKRIYQFWSKEVNMSTQVVQRLIYLLRKYATNGETHFLGLCTQLMLDPAIESADSKKQIFEFEDDRDAKLHEYHISTRARSRNTYTLPPLFAESQQSRPSLFKATQLCSLVRDTNANYAFEPTQDPREITQAKQNFTLQSQSSMPFQIATQVLNRRSQRISSENLKQSSPHMLRRRFLKDTEKEKRDTVLRVIHVRQKNAERTAQKAKENNVGLYRRYRFGEYPDLLINNLAFLLPLQALARRDLLVAKQLFVAIFTAIFDAEESGDFLQEIDEIFQLVLQNSTTCESTTFSAFLEVSLLKPSAFNLPPVVVANLSKLTKNLTIGALYLENRLIADWDEDIAETMEPQHWLQLSDIYSSLKEFEVVSAIFADKIRTDPRLAEAIELRANGRADEAQSLLIEVIGRNVHIEHYYAYNCYYECSVELSNWSHVTEAIHNEIDHIEDLWTDDYNLNFLLPKYIHAKIQLLLEGDVEGKDFLETFKEWMMIPDKSEYIKNEFCEELMMLWIANKSFRQCQVLYENYLKKFLKEWSVTSSLCTKTKLDNLLNAQRVAEIDHYAQQFLQGFNESCATQLCKKWNSCYIDPTESLRLWNTVVGYRKYVAALGAKSLQDARIDEPQEELFKSVYHMTLQLFNAAEHQKNFALAQRIYELLTPNNSDPTEALSHELSRIKNTFLQIHRTENCAGSIEAAWKAITALLQAPTIQLHPNQHIEALGLKSRIAMGVLEKLDRQQLDDEAKATLRKFTNNKSNDLKEEFIELTLETLKTKVSVATSQPIIDVKTRADSLFSLAQFSYDNLSSIDSENRLRLDLEKMFIHSVLEGMKCGSKEARQLFPCVLQLSFIENFFLHDYFKEHSADVPVWAYLTWVPQILSRLHLTEPCYLDDIVQKIAHKYPEALRYPFTIWHKQTLLQLSLTRSIDDYTDRGIIREITDSLRHRLCDKLVKSFRYLAIPEAFLIAQLESFDRDIRNHSNIDDAQFHSLTEKLLQDVYCEEEGLQGEAYRRLLRYKGDLEGLKNLSFARHEDRLRKILSNIVRSLRSYLQNTHSSLPGTMVRLETICPWLANYQWCGEEDSIELPGQYAQLSLESDPHIMKHTKIVRFNSKIRVLVSQRYPLRITIHGSNGRSYDFLVKHGEDLKQDQSIQQILELMSQKLREDKSCQSHNLYIRTYKVIPIDRNCGLLSWVRNTVSLHDFILKSFGRNCPNSNEIISQVVRSYLEFIGRPSHAAPNGSNLIVYGTAASTYTREQLIQNLRSLENRVDYDILKKALMELAISPGSFFVLRNNFATTLAAMNIAHWILGVGDRHLQNTLISIKDGSVTGIDFGFTFGSGTRDQKVPELTPFRLTPHMVNAMTPMGTSGLIFKCMVYALKVFRNADRILLACMEVFVREPSVNWLDMARNNANEGEELILRAWEPIDRIDIARCKLQGFNPMHLFERELNVGLISMNIEFLGGYIRILRGHNQHNIRSRLNKEKLSVEDQVKCLIDQATDPAVLGISYVGFSPWI